MMKLRFAMPVALAALVLAGCQKNQNLGTVAVDLYIHPESASSDDVLLQTAIRRGLDADELTRLHIHVRVVGMRCASCHLLAFEVTKTQPLGIV